MQLNLDPRFAGVVDLGPVVSHHSISQLNRWTGLIVGLDCLTATLLLLSVAVSTYFNLNSQLSGPYRPNLILPAFLA